MRLKQLCLTLLASGISSVAGHLVMSHPMVMSFPKDYQSYMGPLKAMSEFPCDGHHKNPPSVPPLEVTAGSVELVK